MTTETSIARDVTLWAWVKRIGRRSGGELKGGMVERRPLGQLLAHAILAIGVAIVALPVYVTFVASTPASSRSPLSLGQRRSSKV